MSKVSQSIEYNYRIAEVIFNSDPYPENLKDIILSHYPNTILYHYLKKVESDKILNNFLNHVKNPSVDLLNWKYKGFLKKIFNYLLDSIYEVYPDIDLSPSIPTHSFHSRVGDVLDCCENHSVEDHLNYSIPSNLCRHNIIDKDTPLSLINDQCYVSPLSHYCNYKSQHVSLVTGGCTFEHEKNLKSKLYIDRVRNFLCQQNLSVYTRFNHFADEDFIYLLKSKYFTSSGGRFSEMISYFRDFIKDNKIQKVNQKPFSVELEIDNPILSCKKSKIGIFIPCTHHEYDSGQLEKTFIKIFQHAKSKGKAKVDLFFIFNKFNEDRYSSLKKLEACPIVNKVVIKSLQIPSEEDIYFKPWENKPKPVYLPDLGYSSGPNILFYKGLEWLSQYSSYTHFLLLESDVKMFDPYWFDVCKSYCINNEFLIAGSTYKGLSSDHHFSDYKNHLNGVALYRNLPQLHNFLNQCQSYNKNLVREGQTFVNFDVAIYKYNKNILKFNHQEYFLDTDFIVNLTDQSLDSKLSKKDILSMQPNAVIVHQK
jgi:hypothetical protein